MCVVPVGLPYIQYLKWINKASLTARSLINPACTAQQLGGGNRGMPGLGMFMSTIRLEQESVAGKCKGVPLHSVL